MVGKVVLADDVACLVDEGGKACRAGQLDVWDDGAVGGQDIGHALRGLTASQE